MKIATRLSNPSLVTAITQPATSAAQPLISPSHAAIKIGASLDRLGKGAGPWVGAPKQTIDITTEVSYKDKAIRDAKDLIRQAETLRHSELPSERSEAYSLIKQAAYKLKDTHPDLAKKFDDAAGQMFINDRGVRSYAILKLYGKSTEEADEATKGLGADPFTGLHQVQPFWLYDQAKAELDRL